jgi:hypothetical protein
LKICTLDPGKNNNDDDGGDDDDDDNNNNNISKSFRICINNIPGKHDTKKLQKIVIQALPMQTNLKSSNANVRVSQEIILRVHACNKHSSYGIAVILYPQIHGFSRYVIVNTL